SLGNYDLVVNRNAGFDTEPNDSAAAAQSIGAAKGVLGAMVGGSGAYQAAAITPTFEDIHLTGTGVLQGTDDSTFTTPIGFSFPFYSGNYTSVSFSTNGLITFGSANFEFTNQDMTSDPTQAAIAPLWDDLEG